MFNTGKLRFEAIKNYSWYEGVLACKYWIKTLLKGNFKSIWSWFWCESKEVREIHGRYTKSWRIAPFISFAVLAAGIFLAFLLLTGIIVVISAKGNIAADNNLGNAWGEVIIVMWAIGSYAIFLVMCWKVFLKWIPFAFSFVIESLSLVWSVLSLFPCFPLYFKYGILTEYLINFCTKLIAPWGVSEVYMHVGYTIGHWLVSIGFIVMLLIDIPENLFIWASLHYMGNSDFKRTNFYRHLVRHENRNLGWWDFTKEFIYRRLLFMSPSDHSTKIMNDVCIRNDDYISAKNELMHSVQGFGFGTSKKR